MKRVGTVLGAMELGRGPCTGPIPAQMISSFLSFRSNVFLNILGIVNMILSDYLFVQILIKCFVC